MAPLHFLGLPAELRCMVYEHYFASEQRSLVFLQKVPRDLEERLQSKKSFLSPNLSRTTAEQTGMAFTLSWETLPLRWVSKQVRAETSAYHGTGTTTLHFQPLFMLGCSLGNLTSKLSASARTSISCIVLRSVQGIDGLTITKTLFPRLERLTVASVAQRTSMGYRRRNATLPIPQTPLGNNFIRWTDPFLRLRTSDICELDRPVAYFIEPSKVALQDLWSGANEQDTKLGRRAWHATSDGIMNVPPVEERGFSISFCLPIMVYNTDQSSQLRHWEESVQREQDPLARRRGEATVKHEQEHVAQPQPRVSLVSDHVQVYS